MSAIPLLNGWNTFLLFYPFFNPLNGVRRLYVDFDLFASKGLDFDHHAPPVNCDAAKVQLVMIASFCYSFLEHI